MRDISSFGSTVLLVIPRHLVGPRDLKLTTPGQPWTKVGMHGTKLAAYLSDLHVVRVRSISREELVRIGGSVDDVRLPDDLGGGYMASDMYTHELHCLNFLRKATYPEYYNQSHGFTDLPHVVRLHLGMTKFLPRFGGLLLNIVTSAYSTPPPDHCIELLRQFVVCQGDVGLYTFQWLEHYPTPYPKFSTWHQCRNTDSIEAWITQGAAQTPANYTWPRVPGSVVFPQPDSD